MIDRHLNYGRHCIERFLSHSPPFKQVLDIGAGWGDDLALARSACPAAALHAIEILPQQTRRLLEAGVSVHPLDIESERLPFDDRELDLVIANQILEHTKQIYWIFHEVTRALAVRGQFIIGVPNLASFHNRLLLLLGHQPTTIQTQTAHVRGFTRHDLQRFVESCFPGGYRLVEFAGSNFYPLPPAIARRVASWAPGMAVSLFLRFEKQREYQGEFVDYPRAQQLETNFFLG